MYTYFVHTNSETQLAEPLFSRIKLELKKLHIEGNVLDFENEKALQQKLAELDASQTNSLVLIGNDSDFETFISQLGKMKVDLAIGFIPTAKTTLGATLNTKDWLGACEALAKRKLKEITIYSVGNRYFLNKLELKFEMKTQKHLPIEINADGKLLVKLPNSSLELENFTEDQFRSKKPLVITAFQAPTAASVKNQSNIFGFIRKNIGQADNSSLEEILHLPIRAAKITFDGIARDNLGRSYDKPIIIGRYQKPIRMITKKEQNR